MIEVVVWSSGGVRIPPICPCCLQPVTSPKEKKSFGAQISDEGWRTKNLYLMFPYCRTCISHVHWFDRGAMAGFVRRAILIGLFLLPLGAMVCAGVVESGLSFFGIRHFWLSLFAGILFASLIMAYYLRAKLKTDRPASLDGHAAKEEAVHICTTSRSSKLKLSFDNEKYAKIFWEANRDQADPWPRTVDEVWN